MPIPAYRPDGTPIPERDLATALASGEARFDARATYRMREPGGAVVDVPGSETWKALQGGYSLDTDEAKALRDYKRQAGAGEMARAFAEHAAETASFGLVGDEAIAAASGDREGYQRRRSMREEEFPVASAAGTVAGFVGPQLAEELAGRVAARAGAGLLGETLVRTATNPGRLASALALGTGERVAAATGARGVLRAGVKYGVAGGVEGGLYNAAHTLSEAAFGDKELTAEELLAAFGEGAKTGALLGGGLGAAASALGRGGRRLLQAAGPELDRLAKSKALSAIGMYPGQRAKIASMPGGAAKLERMSERLLGEERAALAPGLSMGERAAELEASRARVGKDFSAIEKDADRAGFVVDTKRLYDRIAERVIAPLRGKNAFEADRQIARRIEEKYTNDLLDHATDPKAEPRSLGDMRAMQQTIAKSAFRGEFGERGDAALQKLRNTMADELKAQIAEAHPELGARYREANQAYSDLAKLAPTATKRAPFVEGNRSFGLTDTLMAGAGFATAGGPGAIAAALANKLIRSNHADAAVALIADKLRAMPVIKGAADGVARELEDGVKAAVHGGKALAAPAFRKPEGSRIPGAAGRIGASFAQQAGAVRAYAANKDRASAQAGIALAPMMRAAPKTAAAVIQKHAGDMEYLAGALPKGTESGGIPDSEQATFLRGVRAVMAPLDIVRAVKEHRVTEAELAALKERRPAMYEAMQGVALEALAKLQASGKQPSYQARLTLAKLLGPSIEPSAHPAFAAAMQQMYAQRGAGPAEKPAAPTMNGASDRRGRERAERLMPRSEQISQRE